MNHSELIESLDQCSGCEICFRVCPPYQKTKNKNLTPMARNEAARRIFVDGAVTPEIVESIYSCEECDLCSEVCPWIANKLTMPEIVRHCKAELEQKGVSTASYIHA